MKMRKEEITEKFNNLNKDLSLDYVNDNIDMNSKNKLTVSCVKCKHSWYSSIKNVLLFRAGCYECCRGKGYNMDEIKILSYIKDYYLPNDLSFRHAQQGGQLIIRPKPPKSDALAKHVSPLYYSCDGYSRRSYSYDPETKKLSELEGYKGTVFEVLGDYHHSNPQYYKPDDISPKRGMTHKQNYEHTMNRLKHIEEQGYKVFYIWITDFRRFTRAHELNDQCNIFDYMNIEKVNKTNDYSLLSKGTQQRLLKRDFCDF